MEEIYVNRQGIADEPHRNHYYTVLVIDSATGQHKIDFNSYPLNAKQIYFISPG